MEDREIRKNCTLLLIKIARVILPLVKQLPRDPLPLVKQPLLTPYNLSVALKQSCGHIAISMNFYTQNQTRALIRG